MARQVRKAPADSALGIIRTHQPPRHSKVIICLGHAGVSFEIVVLALYIAHVINGGGTFYVSKASQTSYVLDISLSKVMKL